MAGHGYTVERSVRKLLKLLRLLGHPTFRHGLRVGVAAAVEHRDVVGSMALATLVDVGANTGQFSLLVRALHPAARIIAFEPLPPAADRFRRLFAADAGTALRQSAIAPWRGTATMHLSESADSSSLLPITDRQAEVFPGTREVGTTTVEAGPLDAFVDPAQIAAPAMLKIDVQGFELEVLHAAQPLLDLFEHIYVEASFEALYEGQALFGEVAGFLAAHGFAEVGRFNVATDAAGAPIQADFLFRKAGGVRH